MLLKYLDAKNPSYDGEQLSCLDALYRGGKAFKSKLDRFLPRNPSEPDEVYSLRKKECHYRSYMSTVIDYYTSWLFSAGFSLKARNKETDESVETDKYYNDFGEDCGGGDFVHFMRERVRRAFIDRRSHWLLQKPPAEIEPTDRAEYEARGLGRISVCPIDEVDLWDWECDDEGELIWATIHSESTIRPSPDVERDTVVETWRVYDTNNVTTFELRYNKKEGRPRDGNYEVSRIGTPVPHGFDVVPLCTLEFPEGMWLADKTESAQTEHFRLASALAWLMRRTCYAMPVFHLENDAPVPTHGAGYYIAIGVEEKVSWIAPPQTPFDVIGREVDNQREEIFRITHQLALGLSNNADTVGRSADSKEFDVAATRVMLNAYGQIISAVIEETLDKISEARGDLDIKWSIDGFNGFDTATVAQLINTAKMAKDLGLPSKTFHRVINEKVAMASIPDADDHTKKQIRKELAEASERMEVTPAFDPAAALIDQQKAKAEEARGKAAAQHAIAENPNGSNPTFS